MRLTLQFINVEVYSAVAIVLAWLIGGSVARACDADWLELDAEAHAAAPLGVARIVRGWTLACPLAFVLKAVGVAAVVLPTGGWVRLDAPTAVADLGGMLAALLLWRTLLLRGLGGPG